MKDVPRNDGTIGSERTATDAQLGSRERLAGMFAASPLPRDELLFNLGLYVRSSVLVKFLRGGALPSASELSEVSSDGEARSISITSVDELKEIVLRKLVREAVMLNLSTPITVQA